MNKIILSILIISYFPLGFAQQADTEWYGGITYGTKQIGEDDVVDGPEEIPGNKMGLFGGYQLNDRIAFEAGYNKHNSTSQSFCGRENQCVNWTKQYDYNFVGMRISLFNGKRLSGSIRVAALFGEYESNIDNKSFSSFYPSFGLRWHVSQEISLGVDVEHARYFVGFNNKRNTNQLNFSLTMNW